MLSIIIPYHNEGLDFIKTTINSIKETIDINNYEIIVVDDYSDVLLTLDNIKLIRHDSNKGVGVAFDTGVNEAKYENLLLIGADVRFESNNWASQLILEINKYPKSLTCTTCVNLQTGYESFKDRPKYYGANILKFHNKQNDPSKSDTFRSIFEAQWIQLKNSDNSYEIPCILGAAYIIKKEWYNYIDGFALHKKWGTLEPLISIKSWMFGGSCRIVPYVEIGHIFKSKIYGNVHNISYDTIYYNKLLLAHLLFNSSLDIIGYINNTSILRKSKLIIEKEWNNILLKKEEYSKKIVDNNLNIFL